MKGNGINRNTALISWGISPFMWTDKCNDDLFDRTFTHTPPPLWWGGFHCWPQIWLATLRCRLCSMCQAAELIEAVCSGCRRNSMHTLLRISWKMINYSLWYQHIPRIYTYIHVHINAMPFELMTVSAFDSTFMFIAGPIKIENNLPLERNNDRSCFFHHAHTL